MVTKTEGTRFKVLCYEATDQSYTFHVYGGGQQTAKRWFYRFGGVYSKDPSHENKKFWSATPHFDLSTTIEGEQRFEQGKEYCLDAILA